MIININQLQVDEFQRYPVNPSRCTQTDPNISVIKKGKATFASNLQTTSSKNHSGQECGIASMKCAKTMGDQDSNSSGGEEKKMLANCVYCRTIDTYILLKDLHSFQIKALTKLCLALEDPINPQIST